MGKKFDPTCGVRIIGIDPGLLATGYGVIEVNDLPRENQFRLVCAGALRTSAKISTAERLKQLFDGLCALLSEVRADAAAVEEAFYAQNVRVALTMGHARGATLVALGSQHLPVYEYATREVKQAVTGQGAAAKGQVQFMVGKLLGCDLSREAHDVTDALAVALCCALRTKAAHSTRHTALRKPLIPKSEILTPMRFDYAHHKGLHG